MAGSRDEYRPAAETSRIPRQERQSGPFRAYVPACWATGRCG